MSVVHIDQHKLVILGLLYKASFDEVQVWMMYLIFFFFACVLDYLLLPITLGAQNHKQLSVYILQYSIIFFACV